MQLKFLDQRQSKVMNIEFIEKKFNEIFKELEKEVLEVLENQSLDKKNTNLKMKPLTSTKQILQNALDSIRMVNDLNEKDNKNYKN